MKGRIFVILLFVCLVTPVVTTFTILHYQKKQVRREVKWKIIAGIDREELVLLKFTAEEKRSKLNWEHSREFEYKDEKYDIVETELVGDTTYYWCWWDQEETKLNKQRNELASMILGSNPQRQENQNRLQEFFESLYFTEPFEIRTFASNETSTRCSYRQHAYQSVFNSPPFPPPETF